MVDVGFLDDRRVGKLACLNRESITFIDSTPSAYKSCFSRPSHSSSQCMQEHASPFGFFVPIKQHNVLKTSLCVTCIFPIAIGVYCSMWLKT